MTIIFVKNFYRDLIDVKIIIIIISRSNITNSKSQYHFCYITVESIPIASTKIKA